MRFLVVFLFMCSLFGLLNAENLLKNGDFELLESQTDFPKNWRKASFKTMGNVKVDSMNSSKGKNAVLLEDANGAGGWIGCNQTVLLKEPLSKSAIVTISLKASGVNLKAGNLIISAGTKEKPHMLWKRVFDWKGTFEWKTYQTTVEIPEGARFIVFSIRNNNTGMLWADECTMSWGETAKEPPAAILINGEMGGEIDPIRDLPKGWRLKLYSGREVMCRVQTENREIRLIWEGNAQGFGVESD